MDAFFPQVFNILVTPPGNLVYHLVLAFAVAGALASLVYRGASSRTVLGLSALLALQFVVFLSSGLSWQGIAAPETILPPIDRGLTALSLIIVIWLWAFPGNAATRWADALAVFLALVTAVAVAFTLGLWSSDSSGGFNLSPLGRAWELFSLALVLLGIAALVIRRPLGWGIGLGMLVLLLVGHAVTLSFPISGNFSGAVRLTQIAAFPLLIALSQRRTPTEVTEPEEVVDLEARLTGDTLPASAPAVETAQPQPVTRWNGSERRRYSADPKTVNALLQLTRDNGEETGAAITRAIGQAMLADLCFLVAPPDSKRNLNIVSGFDLIREEALEPLTIDKDRVPMLAGAVQRSRALRLPSGAGQTSLPDLHALGEALGLNEPNNVLLVPMIDPAGASQGALMLVSPYSNRVWSIEDQAYLTNLAENLALILQQARQQSNRTGEVDRYRQQVEQLIREKQELAQQVERFKPAGSEMPEDLQALLAMQEETQDLIAQLQADNDQLRQALAQSSTFAELSSDSRMEEELRHALSESARLQNALAEANARILEMQRNSPVGQPADSQRLEEAAALSRELRQPLSALAAEVDALSAPSNNEEPARALSRVRAATERIRGLLDELALILNPEQTVEDFTPSSADLTSVIDGAVGEVARRLSEKNISLRVDLPDQPVQIKTDLKALQTVLVNLLSNAGEVTPNEGTIRLTAHVQDTDLDRPYLLLQVVDSGGGITPEDMPRVFSRIEEGSSPIHGVALPAQVTAARSLIEALSGRLLVDTDAKQTSTFTVLLPLLPQLSAEEASDL